MAQLARLMIVWIAASFGLGALWVLLGDLLAMRFGARCGAEPGSSRRGDASRITADIPEPSFSAIVGEQLDTWIVLRDQHADGPRQLPRLPRGSLPPSTPGQPPRAARCGHLESAFPHARRTPRGCARTGMQRNRPQYPFRVRVCRPE